MLGLMLETTGNPGAKATCVNLQLLFGIRGLFAHHNAVQVRNFAVFIS